MWNCCEAFVANSAKNRNLLKLKLNLWMRRNFKSDRVLSTLSCLLHPVSWASRGFERAKDSWRHRRGCNWEEECVFTRQMYQSTEVDYAWRQFCKVHTEDEWHRWLYQCDISASIWFNAALKTWGPSILSMKRSRTAPHKAFSGQTPSGYPHQC